MKSVLAAAVFAVALAASAATPPAVPITLPSRAGPVTFDHKLHAARKCTQCHKTEAGGPIDGLRKTGSKEKAHATCHDCHKQEGKGPQKCGDCHKR